MTQDDIRAAASLLVGARRGAPLLDGLPIEPASIAEAHAVQDAVTVALALPVGGYKATALPGQEPNRGVIYAGTIVGSPARVPAAQVPLCGVEGEVAFRFRADVPPRRAPYSREEIAAVVQPCAAIELVTSRFEDQTARTALEKLADCVSNGGLVCAEPVSNWRGLDLAGIHVTLLVNGGIVVDQNGGNPSGDPLNVAVALGNLLRDGPGVRAGQVVTCGSFTGLRFLKRGDRCVVRFEGIGSAEVTFT